MKIQLQAITKLSFLLNDLAGNSSWIMINDFPKGSCKLTFNWNRQLAINPGTRSWRYKFISWRFLGVCTAKFFHLQASFNSLFYYYSFPEAWHSAHSLGGLILALPLSQPISFSHGQMQIILSNCLT